MIPYRYVAEMVCDKMAAGLAYEGKNWKRSTQMEYWEKNKDKELANEKIKEMLTEVFKQVSEQGINKTITSKNLKKLYQTYCVEKGSSI